MASGKYLGLKYTKNWTVISTLCLNMKHYKHFDKDYSVNLQWLNSKGPTKAPHKKVVATVSFLQIHFNKIHFNKIDLHPFHTPLADPRGAPGTRAPPGGPNSFIFMQFSAKMWKIIAILGVGAPPGENPGSATEHNSRSCMYMYFHLATEWDFSWKLQFSFSLWVL